MAFLSYLLIWLIACGIIYLIMPSEENRTPIQSESIVRALLWLGGLLTLAVIAAFLFFLAGVDISSKKLELNAFGDYLAGSSTFLAFMWLIITVIIQTLELRNQHIEMTRMSQSADEQADSLRKALRFQALGYLEDKEEEKNPYLSERLKIVAEVTVSFHERHKVIVGPTDFYLRPKEGVAYAASILCNEDLRTSPVYNEIPISLTSDFDVDDHLFLVDLISQASYVRKSVAPIKELAEEMGAVSNYEAWIQEADLDWLLNWEPRIREIEQEMSKLIAVGDGEGFSDTQRSVAAIFSQPHS